MQQRRPSVCDMVHSAHAQLIQKNRLKLMSILKCVVFCGKQNIALRGHRDDKKSTESGCNPGNFRALLKFPVESGDTILKEHFVKSKKMQPIPQKLPRMNSLRLQVNGYNKKF